MSQLAEDAKVWCKHLVWQGPTINRSYGFWGYQAKPEQFVQNFDSHGWTRCPICGKEKP